MPLFHHQHGSFSRLVFLSLLLAAPVAASAEALLVSGQPFAIGDGANGSSELADVTPDGRFVAVTTRANNLHGADADLNGRPDVYLLDRGSGAWHLISHRAGQAHRSASSIGGGSTAAALSDDGRYVLYSSDAPDLLATPQFSFQVYLYDRVLGTNSLVSHLPGQPETGASTGSQALDLSADGRYALFTSSAAELIDGSAGFAQDALFLFDRQTGVNRLVTHAAVSASTYASGRSTLRQISPDGRFVLFDSMATNLVLGVTDSANTNDVFLWDRDSNIVELISRHPSQPAALGAFATGLSADGRFVLLSSPGALQAGMTDANFSAYDCFLHDRQIGSARLVSRQAASTLASGNQESICNALSADGRYVYFSSQAGDLVTPFFDGNAALGTDIFLYDRTSGSVTLASHAAGGAATGGNGSSWTYRARPGAVSADGGYLLYASAASDLDAGSADGNGAVDFYLYDRASGTSLLASRRGDSAVAAGVQQDYTTRIEVGTGGEALFSTETDLSANGGDANLTLDVHHFDPAEGRTGLVSATTVGGINATGAGTIFTNNHYLSPDGRFVFWKNWSYDRVLGARQLTGHRAGEPATPANGPIRVQGIDAAGRFVLLGSQANDLVAGAQDPNGTNDVFLYDRSDKSAFLVSHAAGSPAVAANAASGPIWLSADGRRVLLDSSATDLVPGGMPSLGSQLFYFDRLADAATLVSHRHDAPGQPANGQATFYGISPDERFLLIASDATDLVPNFVDTNGAGVQDLYLYDRIARQSVLVTHRAGTANVGGNGAFGYAATTGDFRYVYFTSQARDLVTGSEIPLGAVAFYRWDRLSGNTQLLMSQPQCHPFHPRGLHDVSVDGRLVLITTSCPQTAADTNGTSDVYLYDWIARQYQLISHTPGNPAVAKGDSWAGQLSDDGRRVTYSDLALDDFHAVSYDRATGQATDLRQPAFFDPETLVLTSRPWASADGNVLLLWIGDPAAAPYDTNSERDLFLVEFDRFFADGFEQGTTAGWSLTVP